MFQLIIHGKAVPSGSKTAYVNQYTGKAHVVDTCKEKANWQNFVRIQAQAEAARLGIKPKNGQFHLAITFNFKRPKSHFGTGKNAGILKDSAPQYHTQKPDCTKLTRCTEDALQGICWTDDSQVVSQGIVKLWHDTEDFVVIQVCEVISVGEAWYCATCKKNK